MINKERAQEIFEWCLSGCLAREDIERALDEAEKRAYRNGQKDGIDEGASQTFAIQIKEAQIKMRERAAKVCEANDEVIKLSTGERLIELKTSNNVNGLAYAKGIRALPIEGE